jgi:hypothetical protein
VVALRATVRALRAELDAVWESAAAAGAMARTAEGSRRELSMPLVRVALAPSEVAATRVAAAASPSLAGVTSIELDLRPDTATTEIVLIDKPAIVLADRPEIVLGDLPEAALLDPKQARDAEVIDVSDPATAAAADTILPGRRTA